MPFDKESFKYNEDFLDRQIDLVMMLLKINQAD